MRRTVCRAPTPLHTHPPPACTHAVCTPLVRGAAIGPPPPTWTGSAFVCASRGATPPSVRRAPRRASWADTTCVAASPRRPPAKNKGRCPHTTSTARCATRVAAPKIWRSSWERAVPPIAAPGLLHTTHACWSRLAVVRREQPRDVDGHGCRRDLNVGTRRVGSRGRRERMRSNLSSPSADHSKTHCDYHSVTHERAHAAVRRERLPLAVAAYLPPVPLHF
jgi:hypothetical protein